MKLQVRHLLHIPEVFGPSRTSSFDAAASDTLTLDPAIRELDDVISVYLRKTVDRFDLNRNYDVRSCMLSTRGGVTGCLVLDFLRGLSGDWFVITCSSMSIAANLYADHDIDRDILSVFVCMFVCLSV